MKIATVQMPMSWTTEENTANVIIGMTKSRALGAEIACFPECATTGYHKRIRKAATRELVESSLLQISQHAAELKLTTFVGSPYFPDDSNAIWNAVVVIDTNGATLDVVPKIGLLDVEMMFFQPGDPSRQNRPVISFGELTLSAILCREVFDPVSSLKSQLGTDSVNVIIWPSVMSRAGGWEVPDGEGAEDVEPSLQRIAAELNTLVIQCNWPNYLNPLPDDNAIEMGASVVADNEGKIVHTFPVNEAGIGIVQIDSLNDTWLLNKQELGWYPW